MTITTTGYNVDERDIMFILKEQLGIERLLEFAKFKDCSMEDFEMIINEARKFAVEVIAPLNAPGDKEGCRYEPETGKVYMPAGYKEAYEKYRESAWLGVSTSLEYGGQGLPNIIGLIVGAMFTGASFCFTATAGLTRGSAHLIESFGSDELKKLYCEKMYSSKWAGTMCLTEPQAGSAVGDIKTTAKRTDKPGEFLITGTKSFITSGEHDLTENIIHLLLAKIEGAPAGFKGISLFIVPKIRVNLNGTLGEPNDVICGGIEHKMGLHASPTCTLNFGENGKCIGYLVGIENSGLQYMFKMMNEARIGVGVQSESEATAAYFNALAYAHERIQGVEITKMKDVNAPRVPIVVHPDVRRMLLTMKSYTEGMRALLYTCGYYSDLAQNLSDGAERERCKNLIELLTPICKAYCSDKAFKVTELAIQVLGGYGYCAEYPVEQYMRDLKIASIYEGTNGIQALDLLGRKIGMKGGMIFMSYMNELNTFVSKYKTHPTLGSYIAKLESAKDELAKVTGHFMKLNSEGKQFYPILNATPYLEMFGDITIGYFLLQQAVIADNKLTALLNASGAKTEEEKQKSIEENSEVKFYSGKIHSAKFFAAHLLPEAFAKSIAIMSEDKSALDIVF